MTCSLTGDGVRLADGRTLPWSDLFHVEWTADGALVATAAGVLWTDRVQAAALERRLAPWEAKRDAWVDRCSAIEVGHLLSLAPNQALTVRPDLNGGVRLGLAWLRDGQSVWAELAAADGDELSPCGRFDRPHLTADGAALTVGRWRPRRLRWSALRGLAERRVWLSGEPHRLLLLTRAGRLEVRGGSAGYELREPLARLLAARVAAAPAEPGAGLWATSLRRAGEGLWLDEDGLVCVTRRGARRVPWCELRVEWGAAGPRLQSGTSQLNPSRYLDGEALVARIEARHGRGESLEPLDEAALARWLGSERGAVLQCGLSQAAVWAGVLGVALLLAWELATAGRSALLFYALLCGVPLLLGMAASARRVTADAQGLSVRRGRYRETYAWSEVCEAADLVACWKIVTARGPIYVSKAARGQSRLMGLVRRVLATRQSGWRLPDTAPPPEAALSRLGGYDQPGAAALSLRSKDQP